MGQQELREVQQRQMHSPALWMNNLKHQYMLGTDWLESSPAEIDLEILVDNKLDHEPPMCSHVKGDQQHPGIH